MSLGVVIFSSYCIATEASSGKSKFSTETVSEDSPIAIQKSDIVAIKQGACADTPQKEIKQVKDKATKKTKINHAIKRAKNADIGYYKSVIKTMKVNAEYPVDAFDLEKLSEDERNLITLKTQRYFRKKLKRKCGFTGQYFSDKHTIDEWEKITKSKDQMVSEMIKHCPKGEDIIRKSEKWLPYFRVFFIEYANDSGNKASC